MLCSICKKNMPEGREEFFDVCATCLDFKKPVGFMSFGHKTAPDIIIISGSQKESIRQAQNANKRKR